MGVRTLRDLDYRPRTDSGYALRVRAGGPDPDRSHQHARAGGDGHHRARARTARPTTRGRAVARRAARRADPPLRSRRGSCRPRTPTTSRVRSASPPSLCGLVGLKPTRGRVMASAGDPPVGMNAEGVVTRSVRDTAAMLDLLAWRSPWWPAPALPRPLADEVGADPAVCGSACGPMPSTALRSIPTRLRRRRGRPRLLARRWASSVERVGAGGVLRASELWDVAKTGAGGRPPPPRPRRGRTAHRPRARRGRPRAAHMGDGAGRAGDHRSRCDCA